MTMNLIMVFYYEFVTVSTTSLIFLAKPLHFLTGTLHIATLGPFGKLIVNINLRK